MLSVRHIDEGTAQKASRSFSFGESRYKKFLFLVVALLVVFSVTVAGMNFVKAASYKEQALQCESDFVSISEENDSIKETLKKENRDEYFEKVAREQYGYCKPGERVYYDSVYGE